MASSDGYTRIVRFEPTSLLFAPSTVHMFAVTSLPLTERSDPPSRPLSFTLSRSGALTPGISVASWRKLRPFSGSSRTISPVTTPDTSPPIVFTGAGGGFDVDDFAQLPRRQLEVDAEIIGNSEDDARSRPNLEALQLGAHFVAAHRQIRN